MMRFLGWLGLLVMALAGIIFALYHPLSFVVGLVFVLLFFRKDIDDLIERI
jgi:predicted membrane protein